MRLKLALIVATLIALPIVAQAGNNKVPSAHKVKNRARQNKRPISRR